MKARGCLTSILISSDSFDSVHHALPNKCHCSIVCCGKTKRSLYLHIQKRDSGIEHIASRALGTSLVPA